MIAQQLRENLTLLFLAGGVVGIFPVYVLLIGSPNLLLFLLLVSLLLAYGWFLQKEKPKLLILGVTALLFFCNTYLQYHLPENDIFRLYSEFNLEGKKVALTGRLASVEEQNHARKAILDLERIRIDSDDFQPATGRISLKVYGESGPLTPGDRVSLEKVELREIRNFNNPGAFDYVTFQRLRGLYLSVNASKEKLTVTEGGEGSFVAGLHAVRARISEQIGKAKEGEFIQAILLGDKRNIGSSVQETFSEAGIAHLFAVSGLHVGFIAFTFFFIFKFLYALYFRQYSIEGFLNGLFERLAALTTILPTIGYALLVGEKSSAIRAAVMIVTYLVIFSLGLRRALFNSINIAALLLLAYNPFFLFDIGFQLSFCAVYAILLGFYLLKTEFQKDFLDFEGLPFLKTVAAYLKIVFLTSLFAFMGTFPLVLHYFQLISFAGLFVNLVAIPLATVIVPTAFLGMLGIWISDALSSACFAIAGEMLRWLHLIAEQAAQLSFSHLYLPAPGSELVILLYLLLVLWGFYFRAVAEFAGTFKKGFLYLFAMIFILFLFPNKLNPTARIYFLDVGQGESFFIQTETGTTVLIDGGSRSSYEVEKDGRKFMREGLDMGRAAVARFLRQKNVRRIDRVVVTHHHNDHSGGLRYIVENFDIGIFFVSPYYLNNAQEYKELFALLRKKNVTVKLVSTDDYLFKSENTEVKVVHPELLLEAPDTDASDNKQVNNLALVLELLSFGNRFLLTSDLEAEGERKLLETYREKVKVLKVGHHGSNTSSTPEFLDTLKPEFGIISVAKYNRFHQPNQDVLNRLKERNIPVLRTDEAGCIGFSITKGHFDNSGC